MVVTQRVLEMSSRPLASLQASRHRRRIPSPLLLAPTRHAHHNQPCSEDRTAHAPLIQVYHFVYSSCMHSQTRHRTSIRKALSFGLALDHRRTGDPHVQPLDQPVQCEPCQGGEGDHGGFLERGVEGVRVGDLQCPSSFLSARPTREMSFARWKERTHVDVLLVAL